MRKSLFKRTCRFRVLTVVLLVLGAVVLEMETEPVSASVSVTAVKATAGFTHGCAVMSDGTVRCFGRNGDGQLGNGTTSTSQSVALVSGITNAVDVAVNPGNSDSVNRSCALLSNGEIHCWGVNYANGYSYMGTGDSVVRYLLPTPVCATGSTSAGTCVPLTNAIQMSLDQHGGCAVTSTNPSSTLDNRVVCWGNTGNVSLNTSLVCTSGSQSANNCVELTKATKIDSNTYSRCAITSDNQVYCWGSNGDGQLGRESITPSTTWAAAPMTDGGTPISDAIDVAMGGRSVCIIRQPISPSTTNRIQCVGDLYYGHLGDGVADQTNNARRITWRDICGHSRSVPSTSSCSTTQLPGSPTRLVGGSVAMCAYIQSGYSNNESGWSCWNGGASGGLGLYLARPSSSNGTVYGYIGQICSSSSGYSASGECDSGKRFAATEVDMSGSTLCGVESGLVYCWGMGQGGSIVGQNSWVYYPYLIPMGKSLRFVATPTAADPNVAFAQQPRIQLVESNGQDVSTSGVTVTASLVAVSGSGTLGGTTTATTNASGVATFTDLSISATGTYVVNFSTSAYGTIGQRLVVVQLQSRTLTITTSYSSSYLFNASIPSVSATASAGSGSISYTSLTQGVCTVNVSTGVVSIVDDGVCTVRAAIASDGTYVSATSTTASFTVNRISRSISIDVNSYSSSYTLPATGPTLQSVVSAGGGSVTFTSSNSSVCQVGVSTGVVTFLGGGTCTLTASVVASGAYAAATSPSVSITVNGTPATTTTVAPTTTIASNNTTAPRNSVAPSNSTPTTNPTASPVTPVDGAGVSTSTTSTTTTTTTLAPLDVPEVEDTSGAVVVDGKRVEATVTRDNNQLIVSAGSFRARISAVKRDGGRAPLDSEGRLRILVGDSIEVDVDGFASASAVEVRMYSEPVLLGRSQVDKAGDLIASYEVPDTVEDGRHTVVMVGTSAADQKLTFALPVFVGEESTGPSAVAVTVWVLLSLAVIGGLLIPAFLRRRRRDNA